MVSSLLRVAVDSTHAWSHSAWRTLLKTSEDPRACKYFEPDRDDIFGLGLAKSINQEGNQDMREAACVFCINIMKYNDVMLLSDLVGEDILARDYI